jgi:hypothetical protein
MEATRCGTANRVHPIRRRPRCAGPLPPALAAASALLGAVRSTAQDSRWLAPGRCTSQQLTVQKASPVRLRLQVETLQVQYIEPNSMGCLQALQRRH